MVVTQQAFPPLVVSTHDLARAGVRFDPLAFHRCALEMLEEQEDGLILSKKSVLSPPEDAFWSCPQYARLDNRLGEERLGWKLSALSSIGPRLACVKIVGANAANRLFGLPRSVSTILLFDKFTMQPLCIFEATAISAARTGTYASLVAEWLLSKKSEARVFLFGGGPIAGRVVCALSAILGPNLKTLWVKTRTRESAEQFAAAHATPATAIEAVDDNVHLQHADLIITATNSRHPVFDVSQLQDNAAVLHLGGDETPAAFLSHAIEHGQVLCDDLAMVSHRNSQSLSLFFSRRGLSLEDEGAAIGITNLTRGLLRSDRPRGPVHITCVGLPGLDLYVAEFLYRAYTSALASPTSPLPDWAVRS